MRLWTFQPKKCAAILLNGDTWVNKDFGSRNRIKECDKQYILNPDTTDQTNPIYCFSNIFGTSALSLRLMLKCFSHLSQYYKLHLYSGYRVMIELEVPDRNFLNMKTVDIPWDTEYQIFTDSYRTRSLAAEEDMEVLLGEIKPYWVVAIREFIDKSSYVLCKTVYSNSALFPAWTTDLLLDGSGYAVNFNGGKKHKLSFSETEDWTAQHGMHGAPNYFTVKEVIEYCDFATRQEILEAATIKNISKEHYGNIYIKDI